MKPDRLRLNHRRYQPSSFAPNGLQHASPASNLLLLFQGGSISHPPASSSLSTTATWLAVIPSPRNHPIPYFSIKSSPASMTPSCFNLFFLDYQMPSSQSSPSLPCWFICRLLSIIIVDCHCWKSFGECLVRNRNRNQNGNENDLELESEWPNPLKHLIRNRN